MRKIFKYEVPVEDSFAIDLPEGAWVLDVQVQGFGAPQMWALVDPSRPIEKRRFRLFGTGQEIEDAVLADLVHLATFQMNNGALVFHLFERLPEDE